MSKKAKASKSKSPKEAAKVPALVSDSPSTEAPKSRPPLRAIRVDDDLLKAAKEYKKASGKSFYTLGYEAVRDRLIQEGFLKQSDEAKN